MVSSSKVSRRERPGKPGFASQLFVLYFPVLIAFGFVFPRRQTTAYTLIAMAAYATTGISSRCMTV